MRSDPDPAEDVSPADRPSAAQTDPDPDFRAFKSAAFWIRGAGYCHFVTAAILLPTCSFGLLGPLLAVVWAYLGLTFCNLAESLDGYARSEGRSPRALASAMQDLTTVFRFWGLLLPLVAAGLYCLLFIWIVVGDK